jgi:hypothetical protein
MTIFLYLFDLFEIPFQLLACVGSTHPLCGFFDNLLDVVKFDDFPDVSTVMRLLEFGVVTMVFQLQIVQQLKP